MQIFVGEHPRALTHHVGEKMTKMKELVGDALIVNRVTVTQV